MGNWLKSRALINDVSLIPDNTQPSNQVTTGPPHDYQVDSVQPTQHQSLPIYYPASYSPSHLLVSQLDEEEQIQLAKRIGLIQHLPIGTYDDCGSPKTRECVICWLDFAQGENIRFLPCCHVYHQSCIDSWLMRSFVCPSCMEPVDTALLSTF